MLSASGLAPIPALHGVAVDRSRFVQAVFI
jgi:hypothetical protein